MHSTQRIKGFSLTELSISLVIIALLIAAVVQGGNLLRAAKLKTVASEFSEKQAWINGFRTIYDQLPGDFSFAADYWAAASTQSGDDNGQISFVDTTPTPDVYEGYRAWEHLSYAQIADSQFSGGPASPASNPAIAGIDIPDSVISNAGYLLDYDNYTHADKNLLILGYAQAPSGTSLVVNGVISPQDAFQLDAKMDDNNPSTGSLRAKDGAASSANTCVTSGNAYATTLTDLDCTLGFRLSTE